MRHHMFTLLFVFPKRKTRTTVVLHGVSWLPMSTGKLHYEYSHGGSLTVVRQSHEMNLAFHTTFMTRVPKRLPWDTMGTHEERQQ